jgi:hypothetical protein
MTARRRCTDVCATSVSIASRSVTSPSRRFAVTPLPFRRPREAAARRLKSRPPTFQGFTVRRALVKVSDVTVETAVGMMPRLPAFVPATFMNGVSGVHPRDLAVAHRQRFGAESRHLLRPGRVPGALLNAKATVIVKAAGAITPPERQVEAFPLNQVVLDRDALSRDTPFIKNRDKFLRGLAASNPDSFLYNFREAFGQPQPEGTKALGGLGQPDDEIARARERPLPVGHRAGVYEHGVRPRRCRQLSQER